MMLSVQGDSTVINLNVNKSYPLPPPPPEIRKMNSERNFMSTFNFGNKHNCKYLLILILMDISCVTLQSFVDGLRSPR